jgi:hypothetical protein
VAGMPSRQFSGAILAGSWPQTDPAMCDALAKAQHGKAVELLGNADTARGVADQLIAEQSGATVEAFNQFSHELASTMAGHADTYFSMSRASAESGRIVCGLREDLDRIDAQAHEQIEPLMRSQNPIARAQAMTVSTAAAEAVTAQGDKIGLTTKASELGGTNIGRGIGAQPVDYHGTPLPMDHGDDRPWEYNLDLTSGNYLDAPGHPNAGNIASMDDVWNELHRCFNCSFPIGGAPKDFPHVGDKLPLSVGMGSAGPNLPFPVQVTQVTKTANAVDIEFVTLPGHVDGEGSTIHFRFYEDGGQLHLGIRGYIAHGPGAIEDFPRNMTAPAERLGYTGIAHLTWQPYIDRLTANIAAAKGLPIYEPPLTAGPGLPISMPRGR